MNITEIKLPWKTASPRKLSFFAFQFFKKKIIHITSLIFVVRIIHFSFHVWLTGSHYVSSKVVVVVVQVTTYISRDSIFALSLSFPPEDVVFGQIQNREWLWFIMRFPSGTCLIIIYGSSYLSAMFLEFLLPPPHELHHFKSFFSG